ncbi:MAG: hypothetical protein NVS2B16_12150 [Chloroflexota bacterium]
MRTLGRRWLSSVTCVVFLTLAVAPAARADTAQVQVATNANLGKILVGANGMTLYFLTPERAGTIICTGACTTLWPPLLLPAGTASPTAGPGVNGTLGVVTRADGTRQITYDGLPLYMFSRDQKPGDTNGQGFANVWFVINAVATPLAATPMERLTVKITTTGARVWGKVMVRYAYHGHTIHRSCGVSRCAFAIPYGALVHFSQVPTDGATWPFKQWQLKATHGLLRQVTGTRSTPSVTLTRGEMITAVYVPSAGGGYRH